MKRTLLITGASSGIGASLVRKLADRFDTIVPYVISCAGAWNPKPFLDVTPDEFDYGYRVDALAHAILLRELVPSMRDHDFGRFFWLGAELPLFPDLTGLRYDEGVAPAEHFTPLDRVEGDAIRRESA